MAKILIIEDEMEIAELERDYLEIDNFTVVIETDGKIGCQIALDGDFDLILLDLMLPGLSGFDICKKLRNKLDIPILMVTAKKEDIDKIRGLGLGADDYITKPFSPGELVARIKSHLSRYSRLVSKEDVSHSIYEIGALKIDKNSRRIFLNGEEIYLTSKEFDILSLMARNPDRVFSKEEIFNRVWGEDSFGDVTTITVHIRKIREKMEKDPSHPSYISTVWGAGYRFEMY